MNNVKKQKWEIWNIWKKTSKIKWEIWKKKKKKKKCQKKNKKYKKKQKSKKIYNMKYEKKKAFCDFVNMKYEKKGVLPLREYEIWKIQRTNNVTISGFFLANMKYENFFILAWNNENYILTLTRILLKNDERILIIVAEKLIAIVFKKQ